MDGESGRKKSGVGKDEGERRSGENETETEVDDWRSRGGDMRGGGGERASGRACGGGESCKYSGEG